MALANFPCFLAGAFSFFLRRAVSWPSSIFCRPFKLLEEWLKGAHRQGYKWIQYDTVYMHCMQVTRSNDRCITKTTRQCVPDKHGVSVILWVQASFCLHHPRTPNQEELSELLPSQWGAVHLFDLCLWFGLIDTAHALAMRGVPGCILEDHHDLGPFSRDVSWDRSGPCSCRGWNTCRYCSWAFPLEKGIWMDDWDADLPPPFDWDDEHERPVGAIPAAQKAAATPLTRAMLDICTRDMKLPFSGSPKAMARLLDIAILTGNQKAAANLSDNCQFRPLRRWATDWVNADDWEALWAAVWAGADFQGLVVKQLYEAGFAEETPFLQALFLDSLESKLEIWKEMIDRHLLPVCRELWRPSSDNRLGDLFWEERHGQGVFGKLSIDKIQACKNAGLDLLQFCNCRVTWRNVVTNSIDRSRRCVGATLLDMAILGGQVDCVEACVDGGVELQSDGATLAWHKGVMRGETPIEGVVPSEAQTAATAAGRAWLKRCWKSESSQKGIVLYQMVEKMFKGRSFPMALVQEILTFAMPVPTIIDQLDLWAHVNDWMTTIRGRPSPCGGLDGSGRELSFSVDWFVVDISAHILPSALKQCLFVRRQRHQNRIVFVPVVPGDITSCWTQDCFLPQWARHGVNAVYHEELFCCTSQITCVLCGLRFSWTTSTEIERIIL